MQFEILDLAKEYGEVRNVRIQTVANYDNTNLTEKIDGTLMYTNNNERQTIDVCCKISNLPTFDINDLQDINILHSSVYEINMNKYIYENMFQKNECGDINGYVGTAICVSGGVRRNCLITRLMRDENNLAHFMTTNPRANEINNVLFQIFYILLVFEKHKILHNNLTERNIFIENLNAGHSINVEHKIDDKTYRITTQFIVKIRNFDYSVCEEISKTNPILSAGLTFGCRHDRFIKNADCKKIINCLHAVFGDLHQVNNQLNRVINDIQIVETPKSFEIISVINELLLNRYGNLDPKVYNEHMRFITTMFSDRNQEIFTNFESSRIDSIPIEEAKLSHTVHIQDFSDYTVFDIKNYITKNFRHHITHPERSLPFGGFPKYHLQTSQQPYQPIERNLHEFVNFGKQELFQYEDFYRNQFIHQYRVLMPKHRFDPNRLRTMLKDLMNDRSLINDLLYLTHPEDGNDDAVFKSKFVFNSLINYFRYITNFDINTSDKKDIMRGAILTTYLSINGMTSISFEKLDRLSKNIPQHVNANFQLLERKIFTFYSDLRHHYAHSGLITPTTVGLEMANIMIDASKLMKFLPIIFMSADRTIQMIEENKTNYDSVEMYIENVILPIAYKNLGLSRNVPQQSIANPRPREEQTQTFNRRLFETAERQPLEDKIRRLEEEIRFIKQTSKQPIYKHLTIQLPALNYELDRLLRMRAKLDEHIRNVRQRRNNEEDDE